MRVQARLHLRRSGGPIGKTLNLVEISETPVSQCPQVLRLLLFLPTILLSSDEGQFSVGAAGIVSQVHVDTVDS